MVFLCQWSVQKEVGELLAHRTCLELFLRDAFSPNNHRQGVAWMVELARNRDDCLQPLCVATGYLITLVWSVVNQILSGRIPIRPGLLRHRCQMILDRAGLLLIASVKHEAAHWSGVSLQPLAMLESREIAKVFSVPVTEGLQRGRYTLIIGIV